MAASIQLILVPGLGADRRMFAHQAAAFEQLVVPRWIEPRSGETLPEYAARFARSLTARSGATGVPAVRPDVPLVLGGVSLGGMIAYEMAAHLDPAALVLIATCRTRWALARWRPLAPLARRLPRAAFHLAQWLSPVAARWFSRCPVEIGRLGVEMFRDADPRFMNWALGAIFDWRPSPLPKVPILQIHGWHDRVIPVGSVQADVVLRDGGHLINMTHPAEVNAVIDCALKVTKIPTVYQAGHPM